MIRFLIRAFKFSFFAILMIFLICIVLTGIGIVVFGTDPSHRLSGLGIIAGGVIATIIYGGTVAIMIENNELLRKIAGEDESLRGDREPKVSPEQVLTRRVEPSISSK